MKSSLLWSSALLLFVMTGCSSAASTNVTTPSANAATAQQASITITDFAQRQIALTQIPQRIIALSNGDMDIIYALGGTVVGRPNSNGPAVVSAAEQVEQIGSTHEVDLEKITFLQPDVVLGNYPMNEKDIPAIEGIGSKLILTGANSIQDIQTQITLFGQLLQQETKAKQLNKQIQDHIHTLNSKTSTAKPNVLLVYGAPGTYMAALPNSLSGNILEVAGGHNIAANLPGLQNFPQYAQLNTEQVVQANPDYIMIMTHGNTDEVKAGFLKEMQNNPAWNSIKAVQNNQVEVLPSTLFGTNPGTKVTDALDLIHQTLYPERS